MIPSFVSYLLTGNLIGKFRKHFANFNEISLKFSVKMLIKRFSQILQILKIMNNNRFTNLKNLKPLTLSFKPPY